MNKNYENYDGGKTNVIGRLIYFVKPVIGRTVGSFIVYC